VYSEVTGQWSVAELAQKGLEYQIKFKTVFVKLFGADHERSVSSYGTHYVRGWDHLVNRPQRVERSGISDVWQQLSDDINQTRAVVANLEIAGQMTLDLRIAAAERDQHGKRQQLPRFEINPVASAE